MTPEQQKAEEIVEKYIDIINETDFHIPEFVTGVSMKSEKYKDVLAKETLDLAKACAIENVDEILKILSGLCGNIVVTTGQSCEDTQKLIEFYKCVKQEIKKL